MTRTRYLRLLLPTEFFSDSLADPVSREFPVGTIVVDHDCGYGHFTVLDAPNWRRWVLHSEAFAPLSPLELLAQAAE